jgi:hypothetical protein
MSESLKKGGAEVAPHPTEHGRHSHRSLCGNERRAGCASVAFANAQTSALDPRTVKHSKPCIASIGRHLHL